jgi:arylsulfatase B
MKFSSQLLRLFILISWLLTSCQAQDSTEPATEPASHPNILLVIADDLGLDALDLYGLTSEPAVTPVLDELAQQGITYLNAWSAPTCTPTRATILTGRYGFRTGVMAVGQGISLDEVSLQSLISKNVIDANGEAVYANAVIGKWHLSSNDNGEADNPNLMGVDYYSGLLEGTAEAYDNWLSTTNGEQTQSSDYITTELTDRAMTWLDEQTKPWFLWLAYTAPHTPIHLPPSYMHTRDLSGTQADIEANPRGYFLAMVESLDYELGRLLDSLSEAERENTLIIFLGDNGTARRVIDTNFYANFQSKDTLYQGGIAVPLIVAGQGVERVGVTDGALIQTTDLFSTIATVAGVPPEALANIDGVDFSKSFGSEDFSARSYLFSEYLDEVGHAWTVRNSTHKLIQQTDGSQLLFDLQNDPREKDNLAGQEASLEIQEALNKLGQDLLLDTEIAPFTQTRQ